jgi:hypothetical protein
MLVYAEVIVPGDRIGGAEVLWVQPLYDQNAVLLALDAAGSQRKRGSATSVRRYRADELVQIDDPPSTS